MNIKKGNLVSFTYSGGSNPGSTRVVAVDENDGVNIGGIDRTIGLYRQFSLPAIKNPVVLVDNYNLVTTTLISNRAFLKRFGAENANQTVVEVMVNYYNNLQGNDETLYIVKDHIVSVVKNKESVNITKDKNGLSFTMVNNSGKLGFYVTPKLLTVSFEKANGEVSENVVNVPCDKIPADVLGYLKAFSVV